MPGARNALLVQLFFHRRHKELPRKGYHQFVSVINGPSTSLSGSLAAFIQQGIGNFRGESVFSVALGGAAGTYIATIFEVMHWWGVTRWCAHQAPIQHEATEGNER